MKRHIHLYLAVLLCSVLFAVADGGLLLAEAQRSKVQPAAPLQRILPPATPEPTVQVLMINPNSVAPGRTSSGTVMLSGAAGAAGTTVSLTSSSMDVTVPSTVTVASGDTTASFVVTVEKSAQGSSVTISAQNVTGAGMMKQVTLVIVSDVRAPK